MSTFWLTPSQPTLRLRGRAGYQSSVEREKARSADGKFREVYQMDFVSGGRGEVVL